MTFIHPLLSIFEEPCGFLSIDLIEGRSGLTVERWATVQKVGGSNPSPDH